MSNWIKLLAVSGLLWFLFYMTGYAVGKRAADRWYAERPSVIYVSPTYGDALRNITLDDWIVLNDAQLYVSRKGSWTIRCISIDGYTGIVEPNPVCTK